MSLGDDQLLQHLMGTFQSATINGAMREFGNRYQNQLLRQNIAMAPARFEDNVFNHKTGRLNAIAQLGNLGLNQQKFGYKQQQDPIIQQEKQRADVGSYLNQLGDREGAVQFRLGQSPIDSILPGAVGRAVSIEGRKSGTRAAAGAQARLGVLRQQRLQEAKGAAIEGGTEFNPDVYGKDAIPTKPSKSKDSIQERLSKAQIQAVSRAMMAQYQKALKDDDQEAAIEILGRISKLSQLGKTGEGPLHPEDIQAILNVKHE